MRVSISQEALSISQLLLGLVIIQTSVILLLFSQIKDRMNAHGNIMMYLLVRRLSVRGGMAAAAEVHTGPSGGRGRKNT